MQKFDAKYFKNSLEITTALEVEGPQIYGVNGNHEFS